MYSLVLKEGNSVQEHIRRLLEIFEELAVVANPIEEEQQVVNLLASLPESYSILVTALEANPEVPKMEVVMERLLHEERKQKDEDGPSKSLFGSGRTIRCFHCNKMGHIKKNCHFLAADYGKRKEGKRRRGRAKANKASATHSSSESDALIVNKLYRLVQLKTGSLIREQPVTCSDKQLFSKFVSILEKTSVTLGD